MGAGQLRRAWCITGLVMAVGASATGCGEEKEPPRYVGAAEVCDGLFKGPLAKTIESVTGATSFSWTSPKNMDRVVEGLKAGYESGHRWAVGGELCVLYPKRGAPADKSRINFDMYAPEDLEVSGDPGRGRYYTMGKLSYAVPRGSSLYFECVSPQLEGSKERPLRVNGHFYHPEATAQNTPEHLAANLTIMHAASLAVAKKLQCENNGGLPEKPVLKPRT
ncbi:hypothetical protein ACFU8Q_10435 [Streptomyces sp. NPDC057543]|uniref:hypothetical protein n=1 Tax=Streptomyces sp. NPDC057543 TaxID=3346163 RepID=UPI00369A60C4